MLVTVEQLGRKHTPLPSAFGQIVRRKCCYFAVGGSAAFMACQWRLFNGRQAGQGVGAIRFWICCARAAVCGCDDGGARQAGQPERHLPALRVEPVQEQFRLFHATHDDDDLRYINVGAGNVYEQLCAEECALTAVPAEPAPGPDSSARNGVMRRPGQSGFRTAPPSGRTG